MFRCTALRLLKNLTQAELGEAIGFPQQIISQIERGRLVPNARELAIFSKYWGVAPERLMDHVDERKVGVPVAAEHRDSERRRKAAR
ncbi:MAG TPA: helix-turn-helix transcriptional regulator [Vicinamibacterales bacterium]|nr:helix-turn-helix transcriptional regulator [Vicinamibacterales bacterium]